MLAVQSVFTDRRAYVNALTYEFETSDSASAKASKQKEIDKYKAEQATVEFPDGSKKTIQLRGTGKTYNEIRDERTKLSLELGDVLKPVTDAKAKMDEYVTDHMVDLTPAADRWPEEEDLPTGIPTIVQINVAEANIVDRCESCHMGAREPLKITAAAMTAKRREKAGRICARFRQPSRTRVAADSRSRQVRMLPMPSGQWPRHHQRRESAWQLRALAVAAVSERKRPGWMPDAAIRPTWCWSVAMCSLKPSTPAKIFSASAAAMAAIVMKATTKNQKI